MAMMINGVIGLQWVAIEIKIVEIKMSKMMLIILWVVVLVVLPCNDGS